MKRTILVALLLAALCGTLYGAMTYDQAYYVNNRGYLGSGGTNDALYNLWGTVEGLYEGTTAFDAIRILESTGATYYTKVQGGNQSANLTLTLPTAYAATTGYVLSSTDAGVLSWVANAGSFAGGTITSDIAMTNGEYIRPSTTTAEVLGLQVYDVDGTAWRNLIMGTNGDTPAIAIGAATASFAVTSTGLNVTTAGVVSGVTTLGMSGLLTGQGGATINGAAISLNPSSNFAVNIATGSSTGTVSVGTGASIQAIDIGTGAAAKTVTVGSTDGTSTTTIQAGSGGIVLTGNVSRASQTYVQTIAYAKLGASGAGWVLGAADSVCLATLPATQTAENIVIPITIPLKVGWTITAFGLNGQIDSAGNTATLDADLRKHTEATAGYADASIGAITQISKTADYKIISTDGKSSLAEVVALDESFYILVTGTTAATTDIEIASVWVTVSEI